MVDPGETGIDVGALERFLAILPGLDTLGIFPERFTIELRTRGGSHLLHVNRKRGVVRPVVAEDSRKTLVSMQLSHFVRLVEYGGPSHWREAVREGHIRTG